MKKIIFGRHAKSSWHNIGMTDFDRPLDSRGLLDAPHMAKRLKQSGIYPDMIYSSDALRAISTAKIFASEFGVEVLTVSRLYHGAVNDYMKVINHVQNDFDTIALFGHNPTITIIANLIGSGFYDNIPTCGLVIAEYLSNTWADCSFANLRLTHILTPKD